jgi:hypothetical protein
VYCGVDMHEAVANVKLPIAKNASKFLYMHNERNSRRATMFRVPSNLTATFEPSARTYFLIFHVMLTMTVDWTWDAVQKPTGVMMI